MFIIPDILPSVAILVALSYSSIKESQISDAYKRKKAATILELVAALSSNRYITIDVGWVSRSRHRRW